MQGVGREGDCPIFVVIDTAPPSTHQLGPRFCLPLLTLWKYIIVSHAISTIIAVLPHFFIAWRADLGYRPPYRHSVPSASLAYLAYVGFLVNGIEQAMNYTDV